MCYSYYLWYSFGEWNDLPVIRRIEKFLHKLGLVLEFDKQNMIMVNLISKFSNDK